MDWAPRREIVAMVLSLLGVVGTLVSDLLLLWLDPRIRIGAAGA